MPPEAKLFHDVVPIVGVTACTLLALSLALPVILWGIAILLAGFALRPLIRRWNGLGRTHVSA
jgi:hypothetical protein